MIRATVAQVWGAPISRELDAPMPDCSKCRGDGSTELRAAWGCDEPADEPVFRTTCAHCDGNKVVVADALCLACKGTGKKDHYRCMTAVMCESRIQRRRVQQLLTAYQAYDAHGVLPARGGLLNQTASFMEGCSIIDSERGRWERIRQGSTKTKRSKPTPVAGSKQRGR